MLPSVTFWAYDETATWGLAAAMPAAAAFSLFLGVHFSSHKTRLAPVPNLCFGCLASPVLEIATD
jgi:hypothetical protein